MELDTAFWADMGEIISGFAVVVTIGILIYEIRKNTDSNRSLSYSHTLDRFNNLRQLLLEQPALSKAIAKYFGDDFRSVDEEEQRLIAQYLAYHWSILEGAFFHHRRNVFGQSEWSRFEQTIPIHYKLAERAKVWQNLRRSLTDDFADYVEQFCAE
jgi:hypothetical protein